MKKVIILTGIITVAISMIIAKRIHGPTGTSRYTIGILQSASHPALDAACDGFIKKLNATLGNDIAFSIHNAQGSVAQAQALAQQLSASPAYDIFFAIATPAAQALFAHEKRRPIIIAAVTDPHALGLVHPTTNVTGTKDMVDARELITTVTHLVPSAKTVGLLYTAGETNSIALVREIRKEIEQRGLVAIEFATGGESDMAAMADRAARKSDVIVTPTDNTVASTISVIAKTALAHKKPLIVSDVMLVQYGALAARGIDYAQSGAAAADVAKMILVDGKKPHEVPVQMAESSTIVINTATLRALEISAPKVVKEHAQFIGENHE